MVAGRKKTLLTIGCLLALPIFIYGCFSHSVSSQVDQILENSYQNFGYGNPYQEIVSDEIYARLCPRYKSYRYMGHDEMGNALASFQNPDMRGVVEKYRRTFPITYFWEGKAKTTFWYTCEIYVDGKLYRASISIPVYLTLERMDGKWVVTDLDEPP